MDKNKDQPLGYLLVPIHFFWWLACKDAEILKSELLTFCNCVTTDNFQDCDKYEIIKLAKIYTENSRIKLNAGSNRTAKSWDTRRKNQAEADKMNDGDFEDETH